MRAAKKAFVESDVATWTVADYDRLLAEVEPIFQAKLSNDSHDRLMTLAGLIEAYELETFRITEWAARPSTPEELAEHEATKRGDGVPIAA